MIETMKLHVLLTAGLLAVATGLTLTKDTQAQRRPIEPCQDGPGRIEGRVVDPEGQGIANAQVLIDGPSVVELVSDLQGAYRADGLCLGRYVLAALDLEGGRFGIHDADGDDELDFVDLSATTPEASEIDIVLSLPEDGIVISPGQPEPAPCDTPIGSVAGRVFESDGQTPAVDVKVVLGTTELSDAWGQSLRYYVEPDAAGRYRVEELCPAEYELFAYSADADGPTGEAWGIYDPDGDGQPDSVAITLDDPAAEDIDLTMSSSGPEPVATCQDGQGVIEGHVLDEDGQAVAGAQVQISGPSMVGLETDEQGVYRAEGLCEGDYALAALDLDTGRVGIYDADGDDQPDTVELSANLLAVSDIDIVLTETVGGIVISPGQPAPAACDVALGSVEGRVFEDDGRKPAQDVTVMLVATDLNDAWGQSLRYQVETDPSGRYRVEDLCPAEYQLLAYRSNASGEAWGSYDPDGDGRADGIVITDEAPAAQGIDVTLSEPRNFQPWQPAPVCAAPEASISGRVIDDAGRAVAGARVIVIGERGSRDEVATDDEGNYRVAGLCAGAQLVMALDESASGAGFGFYDADADGRPDPLNLESDDSAVTGVDIQLSESWSSVLMLGPGGVGVGDCPDCVGIEPIRPEHGTR